MQTLRLIKNKNYILGNGIAAIAEGEIITFEQLRKSLGSDGSQTSPYKQKTNQSSRN